MKRPLAASLAALVLAATACGDSGSDSDRPEEPAPASGETAPERDRTSDGRGNRGPRPAKREFISREDSKCRANRSSRRRADQNFEQVINRLRADRLDDAARVAGQAGELLRAEQEELRASRPPRTGRADLERLLESYDDRIALLAQLSSAARRQDVGGVLSLKSRIVAFRNRHRAIARSYGFKVCGVESVTPSP